MSEYIRKRKIDTNECPNIYSWPIYSNIRIFEYIRHTLIQTSTYDHIVGLYNGLSIYAMQCNAMIDWMGDDGDGFTTM